MLTAKEDGYYETPRREMLQFAPKGARTFLDVGCGAGAFGAELARHHPGAVVDGVELNAEAADRARQKLRRVWAGSVMELLGEIPDGEYDCVFFNDVLEHLENPHAVLDAIKAKLSAGGVVVSSIPNVRHFRVLADLLFRKDWRYVESGVLDNTHLRFFTKKSMLRMFEECGYEVLAIQGISRSRSLRPFVYMVLTLGMFDPETLYLQFATVARPRG